MDFFGEGLRDAWQLLVHGDVATWQATWLSVWTSLAAIAIGAALVAFGRVLTELGVVLVAGGGILGYTRTLPAQVALEAARGEFGPALATGALLLLLACAAALVAVPVGRRRR